MNAISSYDSAFRVCDMILRGLSVFPRIGGVFGEDLKCKCESKGLEDVLRKFGGQNDKFGSCKRAQKSISSEHSAATKVTAQQGRSWPCATKTVAAPIIWAPRSTCQLSRFCLIFAIFRTFNAFITFLLLVFHGQNVLEFILQLS